MRSTLGESERVPLEESGRVPLKEGGRGGMLPQIVLDDERFAGIMEQAKKRISEIFPAWTDYNAHDPGITILELFAWLKEMQQFHMDRIGEEHIRAYLLLMGMTQIKKCASEAVIRIDGLLQPQFFPQGSRFFAGDVCFEAQAPIRVGPAKVVRLRAQGNEIRIGISGPLRAHIAHRFSIRTAYEESGRPNPVGAWEDFYPLAEISLFFQGKDGVKGKDGERRAEIRSDTTHQLLEDGFLEFVLDEETAEGEEGLYWLRLVLDRWESVAAPAVAGISLHEIPACQRRTIAQCYDGTLRAGEDIRVSSYLAFTGKFLLMRREGAFFFPYGGRVEKKIGDEEVLFSLPELAEKEDMDYRIIFYEEEMEQNVIVGEGTGLPCQEYETGIPGLCAEGLILMTETQTGSGRYVCAQACEDLMQAGPLDAVFLFREEDGTICFGDCDHGAAPEGNILLAAACASLGRGGNVKEGSISRFGDGAGTLTVTNKRPAVGGRDTETVGECRERLLADMERARRAVTYADYEKLALETPGLRIESVRAIPITELKKQDGTMQEECVALVVKPAAQEAEPMLSHAYRENILRALEPGRLLGTRIVVLSPEYIGIFLFAEITVSVREESAGEQIREALAVFFDKIRGAFGTVVRTGAIYGILDVLDIVVNIHSLSLDAKGKDLRRSRSGDLILPANGLAYLKECTLSLSSDR